MFVEEKRIDDNHEQFYICRLFDVPPVNQNPISVGDEFFYLYDEKRHAFEEICLKVEKIALRPKIFVDTVYYGHRGGFYFSGWGHENIKPNMLLSNFKL